MNGTQISVLPIIVSFVGIIIYFIPTIIAFKRKQLNKIKIFLFIFFFGWTVVLWIIALVLACESTNKN